MVKKIAENFNRLSWVHQRHRQTDRRQMERRWHTANVNVSHPLGDIGVTHRVHLWLDGMRVVDFLSAIIELFSLALTAAALLSEICRNQRCPRGMGHFERKF